MRDNRNGTSSGGDKGDEAFKAELTEADKAELTEAELDELLTIAFGSAGPSATGERIAELKKAVVIGSHQVERLAAMGVSMLPTIRSLTSPKLKGSYDLKKRIAGLVARRLESKTRR